jgi:hypothetical protein
MALLLVTLALSGCRLMETGADSAKHALACTLFRSLFRLQNSAPLTQNTIRPTVDAKVTAAPAPSTLEAAQAKAPVLNPDSVEPAQIAAVDFARLMTDTRQPRIDIDALIASTERPQIEVERIVAGAQRRADRIRVQESVARALSSAARCHATAVEQSVVVLRTM